MTHSPTSPFWDRAARKYAARPIGNMEAYEQSLDRVRAYLSKTDTVLEMGCGTASTAILLAPHVGHITASDISAEMVEIGREKVWNDSIRNVSNVQGSIGDEGLTGLYDTILAFNLLHLVPDLEATLGQVRSQLPKGGLFISKTPCLKSWSWFLRPVLTVLRAVGKAPPVSLLNPDRLVQRIASAGFEIVETGDYPRKPPARFVVARKL